MAFRSVVLLLSVQSCLALTWNTNWATNTTTNTTKVVCTGSKHPKQHDGNGDFVDSCYKGSKDILFVGKLSETIIIRSWDFSTNSGTVDVELSGIANEHMENLEVSFPQRSRTFSFSVGVGGKALHTDISWCGDQKKFKISSKYSSFAPMEYDLKDKKGC
mmetsp:Transcript_114121/g.254669  ORF Transcript_114121/g.254669 Transcript_114121/m.254669 type:complete len:160 (+) Transcript_114121:2-481(+)